MKQQRRGEERRKREHDRECTYSSNEEETSGRLKARTRQSSTEETKLEGNAIVRIQRHFLTENCVCTFFVELFLGFGTYLFQLIC